MSWQDKINNNIIITTGDGKTWEPLYKLTAKTVEFHVSEFDYVNVEGTFVDRREARGKRHSFEFTFQGEDHLDISESFDTSSKDKRAWNISHPYWGKLIVQPLNLKFNNTGINTTIITGDFIETISKDYPTIGTLPIDVAKKNVVKQKELTVENYSNVAPKSSDLAALTNDATDVYNLGASSVSDTEISNGYFKSFQTLLSSINNYAGDASLLATFSTDLMIYPALFSESVRSRLKLLISQFEVLSKNVTNLLTPNEKTGYEMNAGTVINAMVSSALSPLDGDYDNSPDVVTVVDLLLKNYNTFVENINSLQSENGALIENYIPDYQAMGEIKNVVNYAVANLMDIAMNAKSRRTYILTADSNAILLAHRFYGLTNETQGNVEKFINQNKIELSTLLQIKAGTEVVYFI